MVNLNNLESQHSNIVMHTSCPNQTGRTILIPTFILVKENVNTLRLTIFKGLHA